MTFDAIDSLAGWGYSEREAAFLYMVAVHSGYLLRRHFNQFVARERGAIATHFLRRAVRLGHVVEMPCGDGRMLYHLADKRAYVLAGNKDSQGRRVKSPAEILRRLMALDYVLDHLGSERFIETDEARRRLFLELGVSPDAVDRSETFARAMPVSFAADAKPQRVRFAFLDEGQRSTSMFARFLRSHAELLRALPCAEVAYVALAPTRFNEAERLFARLMPLRYAALSACPFGVEQLIRWLEVRHRFYRGRDPISPADHQFLIQGEKTYCAPVHAGLIASWENGAMNAPKIRALFREEQHRVSFTTEVIQASYPRSIGPAPGYPAGYDNKQKYLFENGIGQEDPGDTCN